MAFDILCTNVENKIHTLEVLGYYAFASCSWSQTPAQFVVQLLGCEVNLYRLLAPAGRILIPLQFLDFVTPHYSIFTLITMAEKPLLDRSVWWAAPRCNFVGIKWCSLYSFLFIMGKSSEGCSQNWAWNLCSSPKKPSCCCCNICFLASPVNASTRGRFCA